MAIADGAGVIPVSETFAELLQKQMDEHVLTQERAAEWTGVSVRSIKRYLAGGTPQSHNAMLIAQTFRLDRRRVAEAIMRSDTSTTTDAD